MAVDDHLYHKEYRPAIKRSHAKSLRTQWYHSGPMPLGAKHYACGEKHVRPGYRSLSVREKESALISYTKHLHRWEKLGCKTKMSSALSELVSSRPVSDKSNRSRDVEEDRPKET